MDELSLPFPQLPELAYFEEAVRLCYFAARRSQAKCHLA